MKSVLFLYPVKQYVEGFNVNSIGLNFWDEYWSKVLRYRNGEFRTRFQIINKLIWEYRRQEFNINWLFFGKKENKKEPDISQVSDIFEIKKRDKLISAGILKEELDHYQYTDPERVISKLEKVTELVLGGFHKEDCVAKIKDHAIKSGIKARIDPFLTETFFHLVLSSFDHDLFALQIKNGFLDPEMHEDDPEEMKRILLEERVAKYL